MQRGWGKADNDRETVVACCAQKGRGEGRRTVTFFSLSLYLPLAFSWVELAFFGLAQEPWSRPDSRVESRQAKLLAFFM